jgi:hypothetical protein
VRKARCYWLTGLHNDLVHVAPHPTFAGFEVLDQRVGRGVEVPGGVAVGISVVLCTGNRQAFPPSFQAGSSVPSGRAPGIQGRRTSPGRRPLSRRLPQAHEVSRVLEYMSNIRTDDASSVPVLDREKDEQPLHVIDPFFAFSCGGVHHSCRRKCLVRLTKTPRGGLPTATRVKFSFTRNTLLEHGQGD